jgi:dTDP-4-dehydrorhamnose 3,5-epimerase
MGNRLKVSDTSIEGVQLIERQPIGDSRGYFERFFCEEELKDLLKGRRVVQINHSKTAISGTIRGLHFQMPPHGEKKIISCTRGRIFDVAVDLRKDSPTFMKWHAEILSDDNHRTLLVPEGFAHGFQTLTDDTEVIYICTAAYNKESEAGFNPMDPSISIIWPQIVTELSEKDRNCPFMESSFSGL